MFTHPVSTHRSCYSNEPCAQINAANTGLERLERCFFPPFFPGFWLSKPCAARNSISYVSKYPLGWHMSKRLNYRCVLIWNSLGGAGVLAIWILLQVLKLKAQIFLNLFNPNLNPFSSKYTVAYIGLWCYNRLHI